MVIKYTKCYNRTMNALEIQLESPTTRPTKYKQVKNKKSININKF